VKRFRGRLFQRSFCTVRRSHFGLAAKTGGNKAGAAFPSLINNGVDHVDDPQSGGSVLLLGSSDGDAQAAPYRHCLIFLGKGLTMLAEKFFLYLEALFNSQQVHSDGGPRVISSSPHVPVKLPAA
jgi:hypothetical protein